MLSTFLLAGGLVAFVYALLSFTQKNVMPLYGSLILCFGGLGMVVAFYFYDQKLSKHKIFMPQLFNPTVVLVEVLLILISVADYCERY